MFSRRPRLTALPPSARARKASKEEEVRKVFQDADAAGSGSLSLEDLRAYLCDCLGFGQAEAEAFYAAHAGECGIDFDGFRKGYASLNPFSLLERKQEVIIRKPGSLLGQMITLDGLEDCEVYICDVTAQVMMDYCKRCTVLLGPCESSVFVRNCDDCTIWLAAQQLRTRDCQRCTFHLYAKTEPIIETSTDLAFAPWAARYPNCSAQFDKAKFDPERNFWNAIFDFTPNPAGTSNWRILPLQEVVQLALELNEAPAIAVPPDSPLGAVTHAQLVAKPLISGESAGASVANISQRRPTLPEEPPAGACAATRNVYDGELGGSDGKKTTAAAADTADTADVESLVEVRVGTAKGVGAYARSAGGLLRGMEAKDDKEARPPVDELQISGLGNAAAVAVAVAQRLEAEGIAALTKVETLFPEMPGGRRCAQILIRVRRVVTA